MEEVKNIEQISVALIGGATLLIGFFFQALKRVFNELILKLLRRIRKENIDFSLHPIHKVLKNEVQKTNYDRFSTNKYKQAVIQCHEKIVWTMAIEIFNELSVLDIRKMKSQEFRKIVDEKISRLNNYQEDLKLAGIPSKTIEVMMEVNLMTKSLINNLVESTLGDKVYDSNKERLWVIFTIYSEYLQYSNSMSIWLLSMANGNLYGEEFHGIKNTGN